MIMSDGAAAFQRRTHSGNSENPSATTRFIHSQMARL